MKTKSLTTIALIVLTIGSLFAVPLSVAIEQRSEEIADAIRQFNKECATPGNPGKDCGEKRVLIIDALNMLIGMANDELSFLPKTPEEARAQLQEGESTLSDSQKAEMKQQPGWRDIEPEIKHEMARRKDAELTVRWAQHYVHCIGSGSTAECKAEKAKLDSEQYPFGRIGLMILEHPTHEGDKEAKHWVPVRLKGGGSGEIRKD